MGGILEDILYSSFYFFFFFYNRKTLYGSLCPLVGTCLWFSLFPNLREISFLFFLKHYLSQER